jgi:hypothetical protein
MYGQPTTINKSPVDFSPGLCHSLPSRRNTPTVNGLDQMGYY